MTIEISVLKARPEAVLPDNGRRVEGFEAVHWKRWGDALGSAGPEQGGLVLVTEGSRPGLRAVHSTRGVIDPAKIHLSDSLQQVAAAHGCWWVMQLQREDVKVLCDEAWARRNDGDYLERLLSLWSALEELQSEGRLQSWPHRLGEWPALVELAPQGVAPLCPDDHAAVAAIWRGKRLSTALAFRRRRGRIDRILGPGVLEPAMGLVSGDWTRDYRYLSQAVERLLGPLGLGVFGQEAAVCELSHQGDPGAWARAMVARDVIISPLSPGLAVPLGVDLGRVLLRRARNYVSAKGLSSWIPAELSGLFESQARRPDLRDLLGLDAFSMLRLALGTNKLAASENSSSPLVGAGG